MRLQTKLILLTCTLTFTIIVAMSLTFQQMWMSTYKEQLGEKALHLAKTVAAIPDLQDAFDDANPSKTIQPLVEEIRSQTDAEFIVVGNRDGIRYSHPVPSRIGQTMVGGDNGPVFEGKSIVSEATGTLGLSLRGKTPIYGDNGEIIGVVSVGFLFEDINEEGVHLRNIIIWIALAALLLSAAGAAFIANKVKRSIFGLEPEDIGRLYQEKQAVLESIHEGIITVNAKGIITLVNPNALGFLGTDDKSEILGKHVLDVLPYSTLPEVIRTGEAEYDSEAIIGGHEVVVNRLPVKDPHGNVIGAVSSFRNKSELYLLTQQLRQMNQYADGLRAQTHEFSNKLHTISGLIQLESYQEAVEFIARESDKQSDLLKVILKEIPDPIIGGLLLGKINRARELKIRLNIDEGSTFRDVPSWIDRNAMVTILGNLLDNAMEAVMENDGEKLVTVLLTDLGQDLIIEVEDNGPGIRADWSEHIFREGFSTKNGQKRGFGLALVKRAVDELGGSIEFHSGQAGGTRFSVALPKTRSDAA
ncbi:sensor histidine kinase [Cohnella pontilimi]|uniref:histidine kinase n=1 Tax=Cohnella pontilimi TaxID=2564100 RepID=A0A4U0F5S3_9BACL|nr:sensor histidine kinase [Cohnella pontilimi]TJY39608.1 sensor histidine kinase [Cohnella pontilimi]